MECIHGIKGASAIQIKDMRATIGKSRGFASSMISSMFMYNYVKPHTVPILIDKFQYIRRGTPQNACALALIIRKIDTYVMCIVSPFRTTILVHLARKIKILFSFSAETIDRMGPLILSKDRELVRSFVPLFLLDFPIDCSFSLACPYFQGEIQCSHLGFYNFSLFSKVQRGENRMLRII